MCRENVPCFPLCFMLNCQQIQTLMSSCWIASQVKAKCHFDHGHLCLYQTTWWLWWSTRFLYCLYCSTDLGMSDRVGASHCWYFFSLGVSIVMSWWLCTCSPFSMRNPHINSPWDVQCQSPLSQFPHCHHPCCKPCTFVILMPYQASSTWWSIIHIQHSAISLWQCCIYCQ